MLENATSHELLLAWTEGSQAAAKVLFDRYHARLMALVRSRLSKKLARRIDAEDIVLSAYRSFFVRAVNGRRALEVGDDLWPLLTTFAIRKLARQARRHTAERRSIDREAFDQSEFVELLSRQEPSAEQAAVLYEEVERLLACLDATAREVLVRTLQGDDVASIATALGLHERTVRRALERVREELPARELAAWCGHAPRLPVPPVRLATAQGTVRYDQYILKQFLGAGSFSKVYRAIERTSEQPVAVKFLRKDCWQDERSHASLIRESEILQHLEHKRIVGIHGWGTTRHGGLFLVADYVAGMNLSVWCATRRPTLTWILQAMLAIADAVSAAHVQGILHCDLKPSNVLVRENGEVVLCDFGLARYATDPEAVPHGGTAGFLCPEQISDIYGPITVRSDVYGLGAMFYALLTGRPPIMGRDLPETIAKVLSETMPSAPSAIAEPARPFDVIVLKCLQKEPAARFATVGEFVDSLQALDLDALSPTGIAKLPTS